MCPFFPNLRLLHLQKDLIVLYDVHNVFAVDALASSHPLSRREEEVSDPAQISEMFNTISYKKVFSSGRLESRCGGRCFFAPFDAISSFPGNKAQGGGQIFLFSEKVQPICSR